MRRIGTFLLLALLNAAVSADEFNGRHATQPQPGNALPGAAQPPADPLAELEQLLQTPVQVPALQQEVTTVTGQQSTVGRSPAAVFVITQEMIRRSGVTSIPEALRMAPGIQVARIGATRWAISARGFNTDIAGLFSANNKLLVLIDGRTVYTPFFNGTYWDVQDLLLDDIDRIEVIRGPGATIWGANAVNGVINVITKSAADTQGTLVRAGGGTAERGFASVRIGGQPRDDLYYRIYGKWFDRDEAFDVATATDDWRQGQGGFRIDWTPSCCDQLTLQGDLYNGTGGFLNATVAPSFGDDERVAGGNMLARWTHTVDSDNDWSLQLYYDRAERHNNFGFIDQKFNTYDLDIRRRSRLACRHNLIYGFGYRSVDDEIRSLTAAPQNVIAFDPVTRRYETYSAFLQDEVTLTDHMTLTLGTKLQHNDYTAWEVHPSIRAIYSGDETWAAWAAVSRATRTPSRIEHDGAIIAGGVLPFLAFVPTFDAEELIAYEFGYRAQPAPEFSWDVAVFFNQYEHLTALRPTPPGVLPFINSNDNRGEGYGVELSSQWEVTPCWRLMGSYSFLQLQIHPGAGTNAFLGATGEAVEGSSPHNQVYLMSSHDLAQGFELDLIARYVDELPFQGIPSYLQMDLRLAWRPCFHTEFAVVAQNLLDRRHPEYFGAPEREIQRSVYGMVTRRW